MSKRKMSRRGLARAISFTAAALVVLALFSAVSYNHLTVYRRQTKVDADRAFDETVGALDELSRSLEKSLYAMDGGMCAKVCAEIYADAGRAGTALSALPFSTVEMEELKRFISLSGDYAYTLCREAAEQGFSDEQRENLGKLSEIAEGLRDSLRGMSRDLSDGVLTMDSREKQIANVLDETPSFLSGQLGSYAEGFSGAEPMVYHGQYSAKEETQGAAPDEDSARSLAAALLGCRPDELEIAGRFEKQGQLLLTKDGKTVSIGSNGVESMRDSRLVSESKISEEEAYASAESALQALGYQDFRLEESGRRGELLELRYSAESDGVTGLDRTVGVTVALDDGSLYALSLNTDAPEAAESAWPVSEEAAEAALPAGLELQELRRVTIAGADGRSIACYELRCQGAQERQIRLYLNADTGKQEEIVIE